MGVKSSIRISALKFIKVKQAVKLFQQFTQNITKDIKEQIQRGISPVEGKGKYQRYSPSYVQAITRKTASSLKSKYGKRKSPVSLTLTGKMLDSLKAKKISEGISIQITDKKAKYHNDGNNKLPRRALIPKEGEQFSRLIQKKITDALQKAINQVFRR